tara:strand:- start:880 stop:2157 length:1278 start_codon:yes stop_codon:yes gene_type:complete
MDDKKLLNELNSIGHISNFKNIDLLISSLNHKNKQIRYFAIYNLGKLKSDKYLVKLINAFKTESVSSNRREIVSSIGRMRSEKSIKYLLNFLQDKDPNIILQAIRGLLFFKDDNNISNTLKNLKNSPNELIRKVIEIEFSDSNNKSDKNHAKVDEKLKNLVINGDVLTFLKKIKEPSIHLTFTSPPYYNARDYSIYNSYENYLKFLSKVFKEIYRITKEGRFLALNTSPIIIPRVGRKYSSKRYPIPYDIHPILVKMGWEFIDDIIWVKPEASSKNRVGGFAQHRKPLAYKPNSISESIMIYRKKTNKLIDWNLKQYTKDIVNESKVGDEFETSNVWKIDPVSDRNHSATFPLELCNKIIKYYSLKGDLVFDPFAGSGKVGISAQINQRNFLLTEIDPSYFNTIKNRIKSDLFNGEVKFTSINDF